MQYLCITILIFFLVRRTSEQSESQSTIKQTESQPTDIPSEPQSEDPLGIPSVLQSLSFDYS